MSMNSKKIIVTGGVGYVGSHMVLALQEAGYLPIVIDNFSNSTDEYSKRLSAPIYRGSTIDSEFLRTVFSKEKPSAVMHFAASAVVNESVIDPGLYFKNNVAGTLSLLEVMREFSVKDLIFSSTCATYGTPERSPIDENAPQKPINPYGTSKLMVEQILKEYDRAYGLRSVSFRYFNAAGAHSSGRIGEAHPVETHLIPLAIFGAMGRGELSVFGDDYDTPDGTCIRDYVHVSDLAAAHLKGLEYLRASGATTALNLGTGSGHSVLEIISAVERISSRKVKYTISPRRAGDPPRLVAAPEKARNLLRWSPTLSSLENIVESAWKWHATCSK